MATSKATEKSLKAKALQDAAKERVMLAHKFKPEKYVCVPTSKRQQSIKGWYIYEKIDGVRAVLEDGKLLSRTGKKFYAPQEFIDLVSEGVKNLSIDGELVHREGFQKTVSIVRDQSKKATMDFWKNVVYKVFDTQGEYFPFSKREETLAKRLPKNSNVELLPRLGIVTDDTDIVVCLTQVVSKGGEGLILRNPKAHYEFGRSHNLLKIKEFQDIEAKIIGHYAGEGKHSSRLGGIECELPNGKTFRCGTGFSDEEREKPPKIGALATIKFFEYTDDGIPRFPVYISTRDYE